MKTLFGFTTATPGEIPLCEVDGRLHSMEPEYAYITLFTKSIENYPAITITRDMLHPVTSGDESRSLFLPVNEPFFKQVARVWFEQGTTDALKLIVEREGNVRPKIAMAATFVLNVVDVFGKIRDTISPRVNKNSKNLISTVSQIRNWMNSPIRCIAWHPHTTKIAIAASDDSVRIFSMDSNLVPILKSKYQKGVSCVAWRPLSASEIAVGCEDCILIWTVDPNSLVTRPSTANSHILRRVNHCPITSLAWSPRGDYLVSAAAGDSTLHVWDVALDQSCLLNTVGYVGNTFLTWDNNGSKLFSASTGPVFRVWGSQCWTSERWQTMTGRVQSAVWSPCASILLFVTSEEATLYALSFKTGSSIFTHGSNTAPQIAVPVLDLAKLEIPNGVIIGGLVQTVDWDPKGRHLAILFKDTNHIAVYMTTVYPALQLSTCCLISGYSQEIPNSISFQRNFTEGSCLAIAWSSGRLQYFPIIYSDSKSPKAPTFIQKQPSKLYTSF